MAHKKITTDTVTWIDITNPTDQDINMVTNAIDIHPLAIDEFVTPTVRSRATQYANGIFLAIHIPLYNVEERTTYPAELDIILTDTHLITGHNNSIYQIKEFFNEFSKDQALHIDGEQQTPAHVLYVLLDRLVNSCFPRLENIARNIDTIEAGVFHGNEKQMVQEISVVKRDILNFRRTVMPQRSVLESLIHKDDKFVPRCLRPYFQDLVGVNIRLWNILESHKETVESLEDTNDALLSHKLNEKMRIITIFSVIVLPSTLYANVLGINAQIPLEEHVNGFWIHISAMIAIGICTAILFKYRKWI